MKRLTLTKIVFEWSTIYLYIALSVGLTLTKIVFESVKMALERANTI